MQLLFVVDMQVTGETLQVKLSSDEVNPNLLTLEAATATGRERLRSEECLICVTSGSS